MPLTTEIKVAICILNLACLQKNVFYQPVNISCNIKNLPVSRNNHERHLCWRRDGHPASCYGWIAPTALCLQTQWLIHTQIFCCVLLFSLDCFFGVGALFSLIASHNRISFSHSYLLRICLDKHSVTSNRRGASATERKQLWTVTVNLNHRKRLDIPVYCLKYSVHSEKTEVHSAS